ncbi:hypothetical protein LOZ58_001017 [Ophidiomyces ophidiicola]|nr:hypothetical protein LOZ65_002084 [Ophidiomyces ophidiicola]KAI1966114.1 hypothetical protein LOZ58_001017 [Ophidiomyces ophidiicola]
MTNCEKETRSEEGKVPLPLKSSGKKHRTTGLVVVALNLAVFLAALDGTIVATALPRIAEDLGSGSGYAWIGSAYLLAVTAALPVWGKLSDIWGRKVSILLANALFFFGSLICALSINIAMLIAARVIQGIGGSGLVILVNIITSDLFPIAERAKYLGITSASWALAGAIGPLIGGAFAQNVSWRWLPLDAIAFVLLLAFLKIDSQRMNFITSLKSIDYFGMLAIIGGTVMLLLGLQFGGINEPWDSATVICLIVFGAVLIVGFLFMEWRVTKIPGKRPIIPLNIFQQPSTLAILMVCFLHGIILIAPFYYLPLFFQSARAATPILSGVYVLPLVLSSSFASIFAGGFTKKTGRVVEPIWVGVVLSTLGLGLLIDLDTRSSWAKLIIYQLVLGIGIGPNYFSPVLALQRVVRPQDIAIATSTLGFVRQLGSALSVVIGGVIFQSQMQKKVSTLREALGPRAEQFSGASAAASVELIKQLPEAQKQLVKQTYAASIRPMYYVYMGLSAAALLTSFFIETNKLEQKAEKEPEMGHDKARDEEEGNQQG